LLKNFFSFYFQTDSYHLFLKEKNKEEEIYFFRFNENKMRKSINWPSNFYKRLYGSHLLSSLEEIIKVFLKFYLRLSCFRRFFWFFHFEKLFTYSKNGLLYKILWNLNKTEYSTIKTLNTFWFHLSETKQFSIWFS